jgi:hypothetical protein
MFESISGCHIRDVQPHSFLGLQLYEVETTWSVWDIKTLWYTQILAQGIKLKHELLPPLQLTFLIIHSFNKIKFQINLM